LCYSNNSVASTSFQSSKPTSLAVQLIAIQVFFFLIYLSNSNFLKSWRKCDSIYLQSSTNKMHHFTIYLFISVRLCTCFRRFFRPSSRAQNCTYSVRYLSDQYLMLYVQLGAPDDGWKNHLKHVQPYRNK